MQVLFISAKVAALKPPRKNTSANRELGPLIIIAATVAGERLKRKRFATRKYLNSLISDPKGRGTTKQLKFIGPSAQEG
jgi:hypothetical protein